MIKPKINTWCVNFTERQGEVKFEVYPFGFVTCEIMFKVQVMREFFETFNENWIHPDSAVVRQKNNRFLVNESFPYLAYLLP